MDTFKALLGHVIDLKFTTHEAMIEAALLWNLEEYQLDKGSFKGSLSAIHTSHMQIANVIRSNGFFAKGEIPKNTYVLTSVESEGKMTHNGLSVDSDEVILLTKNDQIDFIVSSAENDVTIAIDKDFFDHAFKNYFNESFRYDRSNKRLLLKENNGVKFRVEMKKILAYLMVQNEKLKNNHDFHGKVEDDILEIIFHSIDLSRRKKGIPSDSHIQANKVRQCIEETYNENVTVKDICLSHKFSERTIRTSFYNLFGFSPKKYLTQYRLGKVHHELIMKDHKSDTVSCIAFRHGFTHMGRFSQSYKSIFLKNPYQTLKCPPPQFLN